MTKWHPMEDSIRSLAVNSECDRQPCIKESDHVSRIKVMANESGSSLWRVCRCFMPHAAIYATLLVVTLLSGCGDLSKEEMLQERSPSLAEISALTGLRFPSNAKLSRSSLWRLRSDSTLIAKIELGKSDVKAFRKTLPFRADMSGKDRLGVQNAPVFLGKGPSWWDPDSAHRFVALSADHAWGGYRWGKIQMLISLDRSDQAVIYLQAIAD